MCCYWAVFTVNQVLPLPCQRGGWMCSWSWVVAQPEHLIKADERDISQHMASCSGKRTYSISVPKKTLHLVVPLSLKWLNICLLVGKSEWIPWLGLLVHVEAFALPCQLFLPQTLIFPIISSIPPEKNELAAVRCWHAF